jgi:hypothetical protein
LLQTAIDAELVERIPLALARQLRGTPIGFAAKAAGLEAIRGWVQYCKDTTVDGDNSFAIRHHVSEFASVLHGEKPTSVELKEVALETVFSKSNTDYREILGQHAQTDILYDPHVAIIGGAARLALKMLADVNVESELPICDIDAVISSDCGNVSEKAAAYNIDLTGANIISGEISSAIGPIVANHDFTMNQVVVHNGRLLYSRQALEDVMEGNLRLVAQNGNPLFGSDGMVLPDGNTYLYRSGFFRGLSFLLRGKGKQLIISQENIDREAPMIGRYWQIILLLKLLPLPSEKRYIAIGQWHKLAKQLGSTTSQDANEFMDELFEKYPDTKAGTKRREFNPEAQARWIVGKLVSETIRQIYGNKEKFTPPPNYTPANIMLPETFQGYDYKALKTTLETKGIRVND